MGFINDVPYTDYHELNLDFILNKIKELDKTVTDFTVFNQITWGGVWSASNSYVKWTVVQDASGNGYISIQAVPVNVALTNTAYWQQVANYSQLYSAFNTRITNLETTVGDNSSGLVKDVNSLKTTVGNNTSGLVKDVNDLIIKNPIVNRIITLGDSYGIGRGGATGWNEYLENLLNYSSSNLYQYSSGSMGFNCVGDAGYKTLGLLQSHSGDIASHSTITHIIVNMGANDIAKISGLSSEINSFFSYCKSEYPNAKILVGFCGNIENKNTTTYRNYINAIAIYKKYTYSNGGKYMNNIEYIMHNAKWMQADNVHPTSDGEQEIAYAVYSYINNNQYSFTIRNDATITISGIDYFVEEVIDNNSTTWSIPSGINISSSMTYDNTWRELGTVTSPMIKCQPGNPMNFESSFYDGTNTLPLVLRYYGGKVYYKYVNTAITAATSKIADLPTIGINTLST